ncbi:MAG: hypothetical protein JWN48_4140 [Myxococcaceae bacterium]|nr:hypothetical protein [Myxococcaceae bacterium]
MANRSSREVVLPQGHTGSSLFHAVLAEAVGQFPDVLGAARFPSTAGAFKASYGTALARFEAARASSPARVEIARFIVRRTRDMVCFGNADTSEPLRAYLSEQAPTPVLEVTQLGATSGVPLEVPFEGRLLRGEGIGSLVERLFADHQLSQGARSALHWVVEHAARQGGRIDLTGQRFVLLGAGAELACTRLLLQAGADVLWVDLTDPARALVEVDALGGSITRAPGACNLLAQPREIAAAIRAFAADQPVHIGMFAYAPGASKEWRLGVAMNAIVGSLEPGLVRSVSLLISPTTPTVLSPDTQRSVSSRYQLTPAWQKWLQRTGLIKYPGDHRQGQTRVSLSTVSLQGLSYQAAQYISKVAAAETYAVHGTDELAPEPAPITVSANVAGITRTRSLSHPLFNAAFEGAARFGVRIFEPETTRALNGYLMLHDLLNPDAPGAASQALSAPDKAAGVLSQQVHGGVHTLPFVLEGVIRAAAVAGLATRPSLLLQKSPAVTPVALEAAAE